MLSVPNGDNRDHQSTPSTTTTAKLDIDLPLQRARKAAILPTIMRAHTPQQNLDSSRRRSSVNGGNRASFGSSIPRVQSRIALARAANSQPSFDFLTGGESTARPPSRDKFRQSIRAPSSEIPRKEIAPESEEERERHKRELEDLKAEIKTLKYTLDNHKQEGELAKLRSDSELREARRKGEDDFKKMQQAEGEKSKAVRQYESLLKEMTEIRDAASNEKAALERRLRESDESKRLLEEEAEDIRSEKEDAVRGMERKLAELESTNTTLQRNVEELQSDSDRREVLLQEAQQQLAEKETANGALEAEVLRLKAQTGDAETLEIIKRELSEQVTHIRKLEMANREQSAELKHFKRLHKSIEVVEEEKRSLQRKLDLAEGLENDLAEARIQRQRLEDEQLAWTAYLQSEAHDGRLEFNSPEEVARALIEERSQTATLVDRVNSLGTELTVRDSNIQMLQDEKSKLLEEMEKLKSTATVVPASKSQLRLERQRALAIKEAEYLRAQLKTYDTEDTTFQPENIDEAKNKRVQELEDMVDQYRQEVQKLHEELASQEKLPAPEPVNNKRPREEDDDKELLGELRRKNRKLQDELDTLQSSSKVLEKDLSVAKERLAAATTQSKTRVLSLRSNPTSDYEAIKQTTLDTLRKENTDLLSQLEDRRVDSVPYSTLESTRLLVTQAEAALASEKKSNNRLKKIWAEKSKEFRESIISLLGWDVVFMRDEKMRVTSHFYPSNGDEENSIVFDGMRGTMKISGGPNSAFAVKISDQIKYWLKEKGSTPCFLAALTLEFFEEANRDGTLMVDV